MATSGRPGRSTRRVPNSLKRGAATRSPEPREVDDAVGRLLCGARGAAPGQGRSRSDPARGSGRSARKGPHAPKAAGGGETSPDALPGGGRVRDPRRSRPTPARALAVRCSQTRRAAAHTARQPATRPSVAVPWPPRRPDAALHSSTWLQFFAFVAKPARRRSGDGCRVALCHSAFPANSETRCVVGSLAPAGTSASAADQAPPLRNTSGCNTTARRAGLASVCNGPHRPPPVSASLALRRQERSVSCRTLGGGEALNGGVGVSTAPHAIGAARTPPRAAPLSGVA